ncbi:condensation domain-containing protein, partial [Mycobacterium sp. IS-1590]|uniref:condensation domain-containing protein n=1 Tax=Mycobacterium sp. IS-1590 TaxID=1772286 RepID=UPI0012E39C76
MRWLTHRGGPIDEFNQTVVVQAPDGVTESDVAAVLQALVDRHAMLRLRAERDGEGGWSFVVAEPGSVDAGRCVQSVQVFSDEALLAARSRLDPAAGVMVSALWVTSTKQLVLIVHHLTVDGVSWRILVEDLNFAWAQRRSGQPITLPVVGTSFARWSALLADHAYAPAVMGQAEVWKRVAEVPALLPAPQPADTYAGAGQWSVSLDTETTAVLVGQVPAAFHTGIHEVLLIALAIAVGEFVGAGGPVGIDVEGHGRDEGIAAGVDLTRTVGWFTTKYPVALDICRLSWAQVTAGDAGLGALVKDAKEQLRALPDPLTYGLLRYLNPDIELPEHDPPIGFNYLGRLTSTGQESSDDLWRIGPDGVSLTGVAAAVPMPLAHTVELNAGTVDTGTGPQLHAHWTWAPSTLDSERVNRLSRLWFEALAGICTHVRAGGGGLTPSDIAPARLTQHQIDDLAQRYDVTDILPLTPLQQGLLFHTSTAKASDDAYAVQLMITLSGALDSSRLREAVNTVVKRHPNLAARFHIQFDEPVQTIPADPAVGWRSIELVSEEQIERIEAEERAAVCDLFGQNIFRAALIRTAHEQHRFVLTFHHIVMDGWSLPILVGEIFASYHGHQLPTPAPYRSFIAWLAERDDDTAESTWRDVFVGFEEATLVGPADRSTPGRRRVESFRLPAEMSSDIGELARSLHTTVNIVLQSAWAQLLMWLTGQNDVAFGTVVSGRPTELTGAESMVGLLINTVPVRAAMNPAATTADLITGLQRVHNATLDHQHLALSEIHRITGHDQLFDSIFVYENYPVDTAALSGMTELMITDVCGHESTHYPLTIAIRPGAELEMRIEFDTAAFDEISIHGLIGRLRRVLATMTADPARRLSAVDLLDASERSRLDDLGNRAALSRPSTGVSIPELFAAQVARMPDAVALSYQGRSMTYLELDLAANRLVRSLIGLGAGPGSTVALFFSRCPEAIAAMLAVLKTGAAYLPIDPDLPTDRIGFIFTDAAPVAAITTAELAARLDQPTVLIIDLEDPAVDDQPVTTVPMPDRDDIAYMIYTSGTTGVPKGVAITHRNVTEVLAPKNADPDAPTRVWAQCHSLAYDASVEEVWGALLGGDRLVIVPESVAGSADELHALLTAEQVTFLSQTPSAAAVLPPSGLPSMTLLVAGEACPAEVVDRWAPGRVMVNAYGPTETTVCACRTGPLTAGTAAPPIGVPIEGAAVFVLDGWLRSVPVGVVGELYVAGV